MHRCLAPTKELFKPSELFSHEGRVVISTSSFVPLILVSDSMSFFKLKLLPTKSDEIFKKNAFASKVENAFPLSPCLKVFALSGWTC